jgi:hypothetical protein
MDWIFCSQRRGGVDMDKPLAIAPPTAVEATSPTRTRRLAAWGVAGLADLVQLVFVPVFGEGAASPANDALDVGVGIVLTFLIGFHWSFVPSLIAESLPMVDLAPTWTAAVFLATRGKKS